MNLLHAAILGLVEGITEFLPVSSTGHLIIASSLLGLDTPDAKQAVDTFEVVIQGGAILAVLGLYWPRFVRMLRGLIGRDPAGFMLVVNIGLAFLPAAILGLLLHKKIDEHLFRPGPVILALALGGVYMIVVDHWGRGRLSLRPYHTRDKGVEDLRPHQALLIGLLQCFALWPGASRSMMTITGGLFAGLRPAAAAEFSFLLGVPTLAAACLFKLARDLSSHEPGHRSMVEVFGAAPILVGIVVAAISAALAVRWLVAFLTRQGLGPFGWYRLALSLILLGLIAGRMVDISTRPPPPLSPPQSPLRRADKPEYTARAPRPVNDPPPPHRPPPANGPRLPVRTSFPKDKIRIVLLENIHPRAEEILAAEGFRVERHKAALEGDALIEALHEAHAVGIRSGSQLRVPVLRACPRLLTVGCFCIGTNQVDARDAGLSGVPVFNSPFSNTRSVAELTVSEVVALSRRLLDKSAAMHRGEWDKSAAGAHEVRGRTLGIVGYGRIGSQVSVLAEAMGMRVVFYDTAAVLPLGNARPCRTLDELLAQADVVTLHVPATRLTDRMIGPRQIAQMKPGAGLINNARGSVVDVPALAAALKEGRLGGAALDVFPEEPASNAEPFVSEVRGLRNVILTPHIGGSTEEAQEAIAEDVATKFIRFINSGNTMGSVNVPQVDLPPQDTLPGNGEPDASERPRRHRILHFHRNVPGVLSKMHGIIAQIGANIAAEYLQTNAEIGYVVLDVDPTDGEAITDRLRAIPETVRVRMLW